MNRTINAIPGNLRSKGAHTMMNSRLWTSIATLACVGVLSSSCGKKDKDNDDSAPAPTAVEVEILKTTDAKGAILPDDKSQMKVELSVPLPAAR